MQEKYPLSLLARLSGKQRFLIPFNVLDLVYGQTVSWVGVYYCPLLPLIGTVTLMATFYIKKVVWDMRVMVHLFQLSVPPSLYLSMFTSHSASCTGMDVTITNLIKVFRYEINKWKLVIWKYQSSNIKIITVPDGEGHRNK